MALVKSLAELRSTFLGAGIEPNSSLHRPDLDRVESAHRLTRPQVARRPFLGQTLPIARDFAESAVYFLGPITKKNKLDDVRGSFALSLYHLQSNQQTDHQNPRTVHPINFSIRRYYYCLPPRSPYNQNHDPLILERDSPNLHPSY